tara:strand:- start:73 stop:984 length:912 start_codon:yes stop_codon:yes gene_type:complete
MGLLDNQTQHEYYTGNDFGNYQFVSLDNIINAFMMVYVGEGKIISKVSRTDVQFHAMRSVQELSYDTFRSVKAQEITVPNTLKMILPHDYVNYVKLVCVGSDGIEKNLYPTGKTSNPFSIKQDSDGTYTYDDANNDGQDDILDTGAGDPYIQADSTTWENFKSKGVTSSTDATDSSDIDLDNRGRRYGLDPQHAHAHGSFYIDNQRGHVHFSSALSGKTIILKYISDGLGTDEEMVVHKFCEEACYKWIAYGVLSCKTGIPDGILMRFKSEKFAETRKAKIRLSNIKIEEFAQVLKGLGKQIK